MSYDQLIHGDSNGFSAIPSLANYTFSSKANRNHFNDFKDPKSSIEVELNMLKEQHKRTLVELTKVDSQNKEYKSQIAQLESKVQQRDREMDDIKGQGPWKHAPTKRLQERDMNIPRSLTKLSLDENTFDGKSMKSLMSRDATIEKLNAQNTNLRQELDKLTDRVMKYEDKAKNSNDSHQKKANEMTSKLDEADKTNKLLTKENIECKEEIRKISTEYNKLRKEYSELRRTYKDLKARYENLETTATSNRADYSTTSAATSDLQSLRDIYGSRRYNEQDMRFNTEDPSLTSQMKNYSFDYNSDDNKKTIIEIMQIFNVKRPSDIIPSIKKTEKVLQQVPKLRKVVSDIANILLPRVEASKEKSQVDLILPAVKKLCKDLDEADSLRTLRSKLVGVLELDRDCSNVDIIKKVDKFATLCYQTSETKPQAKEPKESVENTLLNNQFVKVFGIQPSLAVFNQIAKQVEDFKHFLHVIKQKLKVESDMKNDTCLSYLVKIIDYSFKSKQSADIVYKLQSMLDCNVESIVSTVEKKFMESKRSRLYTQTGQM